jgi:protein-tyrosine kinase
LKRSKNHKLWRSLITVKSKNRQSSEQYRSLRSNINFASINKEVRSLVITSPRAGDGKTTTASNLAIVFAQEGKRVLLVDADLRKPSVHWLFHLPNQFGLSNYLIGQMELEPLLTNVYPNLDILTSGTVPPNPSELLSSLSMKEFLRTIKEQYDLIILDTPPVLVITDATLIANQCDGTMLVVRAKKSEMKDVQKAKEQLGFAGATVLGAVINGKKQQKDSYYYT